MKNLYCKSDKFKTDELDYWKNYELHDHFYIRDEDDDFDFILDFYFQYSCFDDGGESEKCLRYFYNFLKIISKMDYKGFVNDSGEWYTVMNLFERNEIVESGVSIRVPWLSEKGKHLFSDLKILFGEI